MVAIKFYRYENESVEELILRICQNKDQIGTWQEVADILNDLTGNDWTESAYRKKFQIFSKMLEANQKKFGDNEEVLAAIREERQELEKAKVKMRDERNELNRKLRTQARQESFVDMVRREIANTTTNPLEYHYNDTIVGDNDLLVHLTDIHAGLKIDNFWNKYDMDILKSRFQKYLDKILNIQRRHESENCYLVIGEILSGFIHHTIRIENNENVIQQFIKVSNLISEFIGVLSYRFKEIHIYVTPGNHCRLHSNKDESLAGENMDFLLTHYLGAKFSNSPHIKIHENDIEPMIAMFNIRGKTIFAAHGDNDSPQNVVQNLSMLTKIIPDVVLLGHRHHNALDTVYDTKVISTGSVCGADSYAISKRLRTAPEQTVTVMNKDGIDCIYDIQLD